MYDFEASALRGVWELLAALIALHIRLQHVTARCRRAKRTAFALVFVLLFFSVVGAVGGGAIAQQLSSNDARCRTLR